MKLTYSIILLFLLIACTLSQKQECKQEEEKSDEIKEIFTQNSEYIAWAFDFPVGKPDAKGYYNAQEFGENNHLGADWNAVTGGDTDLGHPIYSIANGYVNFVKDLKGGWGKVIRIWHLKEDGEIVESLYAHCQDIFVQEGVFVSKGQKIATIGNVDGKYLAHLHFEIRDDVNLPIGHGYATQTGGYLDPTQFIKENRE